MTDYEFQQKDVIQEDFLDVKMTTLCHFHVITVQEEALLLQMYVLINASHFKISLIEMDGPVLTQPV